MLSRSLGGEVPGPALRIRRADERILLLSAPPFISFSRMIADSIWESLKIDQSIHFNFDVNPFTAWFLCSQTARQIIGHANIKNDSAAIGD